MKKFFSLFKIDSLNTIRSGFHYAIIALGILFVVLVNFVIPEQVNIAPEEIFYDGTENKVIENFIKESGEEAVLYKNYGEFIKAVRDSRGSIGIAASGDTNNLDFEIISRNKVSGKTLNVVRAALDYVAAKISGSEEAGNISIEYMREKSTPIPFNKNFIPLFLTFEVVMFGFLLIAVMSFQEKEERSIHAYRVSASGTMQYIWSKVSVITIMGILYGVASVMLTAGVNVDYINLIIIIVLSSIFMSLLGLFLSVFFKNISEFIIVSFTVLALLQLPTVSYFNPSFSPSYLRWMPSYPILFGVREILFPTGKEGYITPIVIILLAEAVVVFGACYWGVRNKIMKSGGRT
ncbi:MAG: ABC transporter permease [Candidatus Humimicrobiaceae bacterium]